MNTMTAPKRAKPPKQSARKEDPVNAEYEKKAKAFLRYAMTQKGVGPEELSERLSKIGVEISAGGLANKISRGGFSASFLMQCADALGVELITISR